MLMLSDPMPLPCALLAGLTLAAVLFAGTASAQTPTRPAAEPFRPAAAAPAAEAAMLRIACDGDSLNSEISINGQFKGECPLDVKVAPGNIVITAIKKTDADRERLFERRMRLADGTIKRIDIELGAPQLTAEAQRAAQERQEQARLQEEARKRAVVESRQREIDALNAVQQRADAGDAEAMVRVAEHYAEGKLIPKSEENAAGWLNKAAQTGQAEAMYRLATRFEAGVGVTKDFPQAMNWYRKSAEAGHYGSIGGMAAFYYNGWGTARDPQAALLWARKGADAGDARSMVVLAIAMLDGGKGNPPNPPPPADMKAAVDLLRRAVDLGEPRAASRLGTLVLYGANGVGISKDVNKGMTLLQQAAEAGAFGGPLTLVAMNTIGEAYYTGLVGNGPDLRTALGWYRKAADYGWPEAMFNLGMMHMEGEGGLVKSDAAALPWFRRAAELGDAKSMLNFGWFYQHGLGGLSVNKEEAAAWYRKAEAAGNWQATTNLKFLR